LGANASGLQGKAVGMAAALAADVDRSYNPHGHGDMVNSKQHIKQIRCIQGVPDCYGVVELLCSTLHRAS
jgi:hypothetical protein